MFLFFGRQHSSYHVFTNLAHVQHIRKNNVKTSCRNTKRWCHLVLSFLLSLPTIHRTRSTLLHLLALRASTTGIIVNTLASNMRAFLPFIHLKFVIVLSLHPCCSMVNVSGGDFCSKTHYLILLRSLTRHFLHQRNHTHINTHTHTQPQIQTNKRTNAVMPLEVTKWRNYFRDEVMKWNNWWDRNFPRAQFL